MALDGLAPAGLAWPWPMVPVHGPAHGPGPWPRPMVPAHGPGPWSWPMVPVHGPTDGLGFWHWLCFDSHRREKGASCWRVLRFWPLPCPSSRRDAIPASTRSQTRASSSRRRSWPPAGWRPVRPPARSTTPIRRRARPRGTCPLRPTDERLRLAPRLWLVLSSPPC